MSKKSKVTKKETELLQEIELHKTNLENLISKNTILEVENKQLKETVRHVIPNNFVPASKVDNPQTVWIAALHCGNLSKVLNNIWLKLTPDQERGKVMFDIADDGSIKNPRPE